MLGINGCNQRGETLPGSNRSSAHRVATIRSYLSRACSDPDPSQVPMLPCSDFVLIELVVVPSSPYRHRNLPSDTLHMHTLIQKRVGREEGEGERER